MKKGLKYVSTRIEDKTIVWSEHSNEYLIVENTTATIIEKLYSGNTVQEIATTIVNDLKVPLNTAIDFIVDLEKKVKTSKTPRANAVCKIIKKPKLFQYIKYYKVNELLFKMAFSSEYELYLVHPKFAHLEVPKKSNHSHTFSVFSQDNFIYLYVNNTFINGWNRKEIHFFQGKFSMEFIQKIHSKEERQWLGVFHASAVSNGKKSILFLGNSGNGKSTSLALLQANGFTCLADDFVPIDSKTKNVYSFPAAISVKENSLNTLLTRYPDLENSIVYHFKELNKTVRFLKPNNTNFLSHLPCKDLVFIKYEKDSVLKCTKISKIAAFQLLVPDSWLSPIKENVQLFLEWFTSLNYYQITYSENEKMIATVSKIFTNDL
ncbi:hypothetical protein PI23P_00795 [Polaribacter irgensii 23-P]|uniref:HPr kinase n=1 Tax=Polaribacter irgensii 23-P TaxID=313594 RepID=A4C296_9FLAO|nr:hypothetical protein [Polaribacter irgensii]EAR11697.1 hypothetical protein PI23P_00795 [Polaribacter irgensii 23-P]